jgi:acetolactate synthase regulatory subunit
MTPAQLSRSSGRGHASPVRHHILSVLVENKAGVLARVAGLFSRRGFNIYSLAVAPTDEDEHFSRITIVVDVESAPLEQVIMQLDKLVNVVSIGELSPGRGRRTGAGARDGGGGTDGALAGHQLVGANSAARWSAWAPTADRHAGRHAGEDRRLRGALGALHATSSSSGRGASPCLSLTATE